MTRSGDHRTSDVVIVGGGVVGLAVAYELAGRGMDVLLLEARETVGAECSYGNAGLITPSHCIPLTRPGLLRQVPRWLGAHGAIRIKPRVSLDFLRFGASVIRSSTTDRMLHGLRTLRDVARLSQQRFEELTGSGVAFGYQRAGLMNVCTTEAAFDQLRADAALLAQEGFEPEVLTGSEAQCREPALRPDIVGAVYWAEDAYCQPERFVTELARDSESRGARLELGVCVSGFGRAGDGSIDTVHTTSGTIPATRVVLAAGSWTHELARRAGTRIPLQAAKGHHVHLTEGAPQLRTPLIFQESVMAATPMGASLRLAGRLEFGGLDATVDAAGADRLLEAGRSCLAGLGESPVYTRWSGLRPFTPDNLPILGPSSRISNLFMATGHGMLGLTLAPITGLIIADLIEHSASEIPWQPLSPARYGA